MRRTSVIILSVLALLGFASLAAASTTIWTSTSVKPVVSLRYQNPNSGKYVVQSYPSTGANFLDPEPGCGQGPFYDPEGAEQQAGLTSWPRGSAWGYSCRPGANTAVLSWQDSLDPLVFEFPNGMSMTAESAIIKGSYTLNASQTASGNFTLDVAGTLTSGG